MEEDETLQSETERAEVETCTTPEVSRQLSSSEFLCHCCYDILVNPTTLNCGHSFCRHCLALWWVSSKKNECPECREKWEGFPKVNILLRDVIEKLFSDAIEQRKEDIQQNSDIAHSLATFQKYGNDQIPTVPNTGRINPRGGGFFSGVLTALTCVAVKELFFLSPLPPFCFHSQVVLLGYHWSSREYEDLLVHKPVAKWTSEEVIRWLEQLGPWASHYKERFLLEKVNGRLLLTLTEEDFTKEPYSIENSNHRKAIMEELECVKTLGVKPPQNLWEYKAVNPGKSLFLLYALKSSPRLSMLYLYVFDYAEAFLPFIHTICPLQEDKYEAIVPKLLDLKDPSWKQWREFIVKYLFLPYQLIAEFAWDWLDVHYWTSRFIIVNAMLLSVLELFSFWRLWSRRELKTLPQRMWRHFWKVSTQGLLVAIFWPFIPQFVCNCLFYWALYFNPIINIDLVVKEVRRLETQVH
ncbi:bifunctional apoptosis regulator isoform X1 [Melanerpes formicivorus]|uniref:bifunctional apoptosis regulator isoform X1 n=1 Tax=Melanerpes formicivorus TaxID=211600 RepID=UPI00358FA3BC